MSTFAPTVRQWLLFAAIIVLSLRIGVELSGRGNAYRHMDLRGMFAEQSVFYHRQYPHAAVSPPATGAPRVYSDYPPYAYWLHAVLVPPMLSLPATERWFVFAEMGAVVALIAFAWRTGAAFGPSESALLAAAVLGITGLRADLLFGNIAIFAMLMLLGMYGAVARRCWWLAAVFWIGAMMKPQIGWAFAVLLLDRRAWKPLLASGVALLVLAGATCAWTGVTLSAALQVGTSDRWNTIVHVTQRYSLVTLLVTAGVPPAAALVGCTVAGLAVLVAALATRLQTAEALHRFAFIALIGRVFAYHNVCDDLLLAFPLIWLGTEACRRHRRANWFAFMALATSLWLPTSIMTTLPMRIATVSGWMAIGAWMAWGRRERAALGAASIGAAPQSPS